MMHGQKNITILCVSIIRVRYIIKGNVLHSTMIHSGHMLYVKYYL